MSTLSKDFISRLRGRAARFIPDEFQDEPERGASTLEYVILAAGICVAAVIVVGIIVAAINTYGGQIPKG